MNKQLKLLTWMYNHYSEEELPLKSGQIYTDYEEEKQYDASKPAFSKLLRKLKEKGLLESPNYGEYRISDRGYRKSKYLLGEREKVPEEKPENYSSVVSRLEDFILGEKEEDIRNQIVKHGEVNLSLNDLDNFDPLIIDYLEENPNSFFDALNDAVSLFEVSTDDIDYKFKPDLKHLETDIAEANTSKYLGNTCIVEGVVKKSESVKQELISAVFECTQCGDRYEKEQDSSQLKSPYKCECGSKKFEEVEKNMTDSIEIVLSARQQTETTITAKILGDIDKSTQMDFMTGSRLRVLGKAKERALSKNSVKYQTVIEISSYENLGRQKKDEQFDQEDVRTVRKKIRESSTPFDDFALSLAPHLGDLELAKKCVAASLIGSPRFESESEVDYGRIHTAIIANPGLGKSAIQQWVEDTFSNTFLATGERGSGSGLTASVEKTEGGQWELIAGKVVFADKGILGVDEFDKFNEGELVKLNSAMESGSITVDLATESADLNARATIIASGNFKHPPDDYTDAKEVLPEKGQGLYDRFALMCGVTDQNSDKVHGTMASRYIKDRDASNLESVDSSAVFSEDELLIFQKLVKEKNPVLTAESYSKVKNFADACSEKSSLSEEGSSNRFLKHLIKLTLCIARCGLKDEADESDASKAITLMLESRKSLGFEMGDPSFEVWDKNKMRKIKDLIRDLCNDDDMADVQDVVDKAKVSNSKAEELIDKLSKEGDIYEPQSGFVALS